MYALVKNGEAEQKVYSIGMVRTAVPNLSFRSGAEMVPHPEGFFVKMKRGPDAGATEVNPRFVRGSNTISYSEEDGAILTVTLEEVSEEEKQVLTEAAADEVRSTRDNLLSETDWYIIRASETGDAAPENVVAYRAALRDITNQPGFPLDVQWPTL